MRKVLVSLLLILAFAEIAILLELENIKQPSTYTATAGTPTSSFLSPTVPQTSLWIEPNPIKIDENGFVSMDVYINTKENKVTAVQLEIAYDPTMLQFVSLKPIDLLSGTVERINKIDKRTGRITYAAELGPTEHTAPIQGADSIVSLKFRPLKTIPQQTEIRVLPDSIITALDVDKSVLTETKNATVQLIRDNQHHDMD